MKIMLNHLIIVLIRVIIMCNLYEKIVKMNENNLKNKCIKFWKNPKLLQIELLQEIQILLIKK